MGARLQHSTIIIYFRNNKYLPTVRISFGQTRKGEADKRKSLTGMILQRIRLTANTPRGQDRPRSEQAAVNQILPGHAESGGGGEDT